VALKAFARWSPISTGAASAFSPMMMWDEGTRQPTSLARRHCGAHERIDADGINVIRRTVCRFGFSLAAEKIATRLSFNRKSTLRRSSQLERDDVGSTTSLHTHGGPLQVA